jgi:hypothetical protein
MKYIRSIVLAVVVGVFANGTANAGTGPSRGEGCLVADPTLTPLNVRKTPNGPILGAINNGTLVVVMERRGDWIRIVPHEAAGKSGWVWLEYLSCSDVRSTDTNREPRSPMIKSRPLKAASSSPFPKKRADGLMTCAAESANVARS